MQLSGSWVPLLLAMGVLELPASLPPGDYTPREVELRLPDEKKKALRADALARARVWDEPSVPLDAVDLAANPDEPGSWSPSAELVCRFLDRPTSGASPKFECVLPGGEVIKVKYGYDNPEVRTEVAATRLLRALGFGADPVYVARRVRCFGCPEDPFEVLKCLHNPIEEARMKCLPFLAEEKERGTYELRFDYARYTDFDWVSIERRAQGLRLGGWGWDELDRVDPGRGGSSRAELDALRLMAVLLDNWDNRADNQRLLCRCDCGDDPPRCDRPIAYMQDVGGTFGRPKLDLAQWRSAPVWKDEAACVADVESPPFHGATFEKVRISEAGRRFLADRLKRLSEAQVRALFAGARFTDYLHRDLEAADVGSWVAVFTEKVRRIADRPPCPAP